LHNTLETGTHSRLVVVEAHTDKVKDAMVALSKFS